MHEYEITIVAHNDRSFGLDVRPAGSTGSAPFVRFQTWAELVAFFHSAGLAKDLVLQLEDIGKALKHGSAYHSKMFLPDDIDECLLRVHAGQPSGCVRLSAVATAA